MQAEGRAMQAFLQKVDTEMALRGPQSLCNGLMSEPVPVCS